MSLNNLNVSDYVERIYSVALQIKDITDTSKYATYINWYLEMYNDGRLRPTIYDKKGWL